jgi:hypothetical protein
MAMPDRTPSHSGLRRLLPGACTTGTLGAALLLLATGCQTVRTVPAPPPPRPTTQQSEPWVDVRISEGERQVIQRYVTTHKQNQGKGWKKQKALPPGLQKKVARGESLPPGWEAKLRQGETMPPEVYAQCHPLPPEVVRQLPPSPPGTITVVIGGKVVRLIQATREILDVFEVEL